MKRIIAIALTILIALTVFSGCAFTDKLTAAGLYAKAAKKLKDAGGFEANAQLTMDLQILKVTMDMNFKQNGDDSQTVISVSGDEISSVTTVDGITYTNQAGVKTKTMAIKPETDEGSLSGLPDLAEELLDNIEVEIEEDEKKIVVNIDSETAAKFLASTGSDSLGNDVIFNDAVLTVIFDKDDDLSRILFSGSATATELGVTMTVGFELTEEFVNFGTAPEITLPEDADEYVSADEAA